MSVNGLTDILVISNNLFADLTGDFVSRDPKLSLKIRTILKYALESIEKLCVMK